LKGRIETREALKKISEGIPWKKVFIYGPEDYLTEQFIKKVSDLRTIQKFYPDELDGFFNFSGSSLFGKFPLPVIVHAEELPKNLRKKEEKAKFLKKLESLGEFVVACYCDLDFKTLKKEPFCWLLDVSDAVVYSNYLSETGAKKLIMKKLVQKSASEEVVDFIIGRVGLNLRELRNETDKLLLYPGKLNLKVCEELLFSGGKVSVFELIFKLMSNDVEEYLKAVDKLLLQGVEPLQIIALFQTQVRQMVNLFLGREVKLPKKVQQELRSAASKIGIKKLLKLLKILNEVEFFIKTGVVDGEGALKNLIIKFGG
jgi:DNA polymerase-3 subunit delta